MLIYGIVTTLHEKPLITVILSRVCTFMQKQSAACVVSFSNIYPTLPKDYLKLSLKFQIDEILS